MGCMKNFAFVLLGIFIGICICVIVGICLYIFFSSSTGTGDPLIRTAVVEISYLIHHNATTSEYCECGLFGRDSAIERAQGIVTLPKGDPRGCGYNQDYGRNSSLPLWIALVKRGNCTFSEKILAAKQQGATAVVIYNVEGQGNSTTHMAHPETSGAVAISIGNVLGMKIVKLVQHGTRVDMIIDVGSPKG